MGRPLRIKVPELTYHITSRTNGRRLFLKKKKDQKILCRILKVCLLKHGVVIYAFTPMMNHFHMLISFRKDSDLSKFMAEFKSTYAKYFNRRYDTSGHFWGDRFRSTIVQDDSHALACLRYLDRNPVKAGLVDHPEKWMLNSFRSYAYGENHPLLPLQPHPTYLGLAKSRAMRHDIYLKFVLDKDELSDELHGKLHRMQFFGSEDFIEEIKRIA
jgi:putative transposase